MKKIILIAAIILSFNQMFGQVISRKKYDSAYVQSIQNKIDEFAVVDLTFDIKKLPSHEVMALQNFLIVAQITDSIFWKQSYGSRYDLQKSIDNDTINRFVDINYGPWERLNNNKSFIKGVGEKPKGSGFYPSNITKTEFDEFKDSTKNSPYTVIKRGADKKLVSVPYSEEYGYYLSGIKDNLQRAATSMIRFDSAFGKYLYYRSQAMLSNDYNYSDKLWLESQNNVLDIIVGPIESYEDQFGGIKTAFETYIVAKDVEWSNKLQKYVALLPALQKGLPVSKKYQTPLPGLKSQIGAYDVLMYAGDCNSGSKTIAVNLPNDEGVQAEFGTRRLQFKNVMKAKFDSILVPIVDVLIDENQRKYVSFDAFFANTMFHEVAHGLGIKNTITDDKPVSLALGEYHAAFEEGKADVLGLYMITELIASKDITEGILENYYTTFVASIFRSIRFGAASAHGKANMVRFNFFMQEGAIKKNQLGTYTIDYDKMKVAVYKLSSIILEIQGDGDKAKAENILNKQGIISAELQADLDNLKKLSIPVDVIFNQGAKQLGM